MTIRNRLSFVLAALLTLGVAAVYLVEPLRTWIYDSRAVLAWLALGVISAKVMRKHIHDHEKGLLIFTWVFCLVSGPAMLLMDLGHVEPEGDDAEPVSDDSDLVKAKLIRLDLDLDWVVMCKETKINHEWVWRTADKLVAMACGVAVVEGGDKCVDWYVAQEGEFEEYRALQQELESRGFVVELEFLPKMPMSGETVRVKISGW